MTDANLDTALHCDMSPRQQDLVRSTQAPWRRMSAGLGLGLLAMALSTTPSLAGGPASTAAAAAEPGAATLAQIERLIGLAPCTSDQQCRVAGIGARPCGGPESYRAWSTQNTSAEKLEQCLRDHADERTRWHEKVGRLSTCEFRLPPLAQCLREGAQPGRCVLVPQSQSVR